MTTPNANQKAATSSVDTALTKLKSGQSIDQVLAQAADELEGFDR